MGNKHLAKAKSKKYDEFYTLYDNIKKELDNYKQFFNDKIIYLNCDDYNTSEFFNYFIDNFESFNLKKLVASGFSTETKKEQI